MSRAKTRRWSWILVGLLALAPCSGCVAAGADAALKEARVDPITRGMFVTLPLMVLVDLPLSPLELLLAVIFSGGTPFEVASGG